MVLSAGGMYGNGGGRGGWRGQGARWGALEWAGRDALESRSGRWRGRGGGQQDYQREEATAPLSQG